MLPTVVRIPLLLFVAFAPAAADDDPWQPVRDLSRGSELRVYRAGVKDPIIGKFDRAGEASLVLTTKNGQLSVIKEEILRIDCRRAGKRFKNTRAERTISPKGSEVSGNTVPGATTSVKSGLELPVKSSFYTVYERSAKSPDELRLPQR